MKTLREAYGAETKFTQFLAQEPGCISLNKVNKVAGFPIIDKAINEFAIPGGSIDVVGFTVKGEVIVYEHQDLSGRADQTHVSKTSHYARVMKSLGHKVLGTVLLCESIDKLFLEGFEDIRSEYERRKYKGHCNIHAIKSQWTDDGVYEPVRFDDKEIGQVRSNTIQHPRWNELHYIYMPYNLFQREDYKKANKNAITYWYWIEGLPRKYKAYFHELAGYIEVGLHCEPFTQEDEEFLQKIKPSEDWDYRNTAADKRTVSKKFSLDIDNKTLAREAQELHESIRKALTFA